MSSTGDDAHRIERRPVSALKLHPHQSFMPALSAAEYAALKGDISARGIKQPLVITREGVVLCGHHRLRAAQDLGLAEVPVVVVDDLGGPEQVAYMVLDNINRRQLTAAQRAALVTHPDVAPALVAIWSAARARQVEGGRAGGKKKGGKGKVEERVPQPCAKERAPQARDEVGELAAVSGKLVEAAMLGWAKAPDKMALVLQGESKSALSALVREIRGSKPRPEPSADARRFALREATPCGSYRARLDAVLQLTPRVLAFVWGVESGPRRGTAIVQRVEDPRDERELVPRDSALGRLISGLVAWPEAGEIDAASLMGKSRTLEVRLNDGRQAVDVLPGEGDRGEAGGAGQRGREVSQVSGGASPNKAEAVAESPPTEPLRVSALRQEEDDYAAKRICPGPSSCEEGAE